MRSETNHRVSVPARYAAFPLGLALALAGCSGAGTTARATEPAHTSPAKTQQAKTTAVNTPAPAPFEFDPVAVAWTGQPAPEPSQPSVFGDPIPEQKLRARRFIDAAMALYGETPQSARPTAEPGTGAISDGLESLRRVSFGTEGADFDPCISRDGRYLVYASTQHRPTADIYIKSLTGRTVTQLTADPAHDVMPSISPDGKRIAFASNRSGSWDIYIMSIEGGQAVQMTTTTAHELHPTWSPDGKRIVFCRLGQVSQRWEMWVMDVDAPVACEFIGYGLFPEWCPVAGTGADGRDKILFQRSLERGDRRFSVWTVDYRPGDVSSPTEIATSQIAAVINPSWSQDGKRIVFATVPNPELSGRPADARPVSSDIWMMDIDGTSRVNLTKGRYVNLMPKWAPDGRVYFVSDRDGTDNVWSIGTDKAIMAATGKRPQTNTDFANVPTP